MEIAVLALAFAVVLGACREGFLPGADPNATVILDEPGLVVRVASPRYVRDEVAASALPTGHGGSRRSSRWACSGGRSADCVARLSRSVVFVPSSMDFRVLGPLEVVGAEGRLVDVGRPGQRALLALLLTRPNEVVQISSLVDGLWIDPPTTALNTIQGYVSRLRKLMDDSGRLVTSARGYRLNVGADELDVGVLQQLVEGSGRAPARATPVRAPCRSRSACPHRQPQLSQASTTRAAGARRRGSTTSPRRGC